MCYMHVLLRYIYNLSFAIIIMVLMIMMIVSLTTIFTSKCISNKPVDRYFIQTDDETHPLCKTDLSY